MPKSCIILLKFWQTKFIIKSIILQSQNKFKGMKFSCMSNIFRIYKRDIINIVTNWAALIVIIALIILPALYAWFNIKALWNPYGNTSGILVAVVNEDSGASINGEKINIGNELVQKLHKNKNIGWKFVSYEEADYGVRYGKYYASIVIPQNFSQKITSLVNPNPKKAELIYSVNEKLNAVAPKITESGVTRIQQEITNAFVKTVDDVIFSVFNKLGVELSKEKPFLKQFTDIIMDLDSRIPQINKTVDDVYNQAESLSGFISKVQGQMPLIEDTIDRTQNVVSSGENFLVRARDAMTDVSPFIKSELVSLRDISQGSQGFADNIMDLIDKNPEEARSLLVKLKDRYATSAVRLGNIIQFMDSFNKSDNKTILNFSNKLNTLVSLIQNQVKYIDTIITAIDSGRASSIDILNKFKENGESITSFLNSLVNDYDGSIAPAVAGIMKESIAALNNALALLSNAKSSIPDANNILKNAFNDTKITMDVIKNIKQVLPGVENKIHDIASKLKNLDSSSQLDELIRILTLDAKKESEFIANPVDIKMNRIYPIPNYGSAMSPFFTALSLWVGGLILVSILSTEVIPFKKMAGKNLIQSKLHQMFLGRYLTLLTIAVCQALVVTLGDIFMLKVYIVNPAAFVLFSIFISTVFMMIIYSLVSVLGNVGKALAMILLVLQISASGGTFPIQVTPKFFQVINPLLPFTYAVSGMRETVGGILWGIFLKDIFILCLYLILFLIIGLSWKKIFKNISGKFNKEFKKSGLSSEGN